MLSVQYRGEELLYGPKDVEAMLADGCYCGAICGRVANRIARGQVTLSDGSTMQLPINNGANHLHGGMRGYSDQLWSVESQSDTQLVLSLVSPDGEQGYPGALQVRATYRLSGASIELDLEAVCDQLTLVNLTHHAYWNLSQQASVLDHTLQVQAERYTPMVENIPTGEIAEVAATPFDLREATLLGARLGGELELGYDDNYCLPCTEEAQVTLRAGARCLRLWTDAPGVQVYTGYYLPDCFGGVALEPQCYPDAPHHAGFPSIELRAGERYSRKMIWSIS